MDDNPLQTYLIRFSKRRVVTERGHVCAEILQDFHWCIPLFISFHLRILNVPGLDPFSQSLNPKNYCYLRPLRKLIPKQIPMLQFIKETCVFTIILLSQGAAFCLQSFCCLLLGKRYWLPFQFYLSVLYSMDLRRVLFKLFYCLHLTRRRLNIVILWGHWEQKFIMFVKCWRLC